jgi:hypothetical protein
MRWPRRPTRCWRRARRTTRTDYEAHFLLQNRCLRERCSSARWHGADDPACSTRPRASSAPLPRAAARRSTRA